MTPRVKVIMGALIVLAVTAVGVAVVPGHHRHAAPGTSAARLADYPGGYAVTIKDSAGQCLDSNAAGSVYVDPCNGDANQTWLHNEQGCHGNIYGAVGSQNYCAPGTFQDAATGFCLDSNSSDSAGSGTGDVYTGPCNGGNYQNWDMYAPQGYEYTQLWYDDQTRLCLNVEGPGAAGDPDSVNAVTCKTQNTEFNQSQPGGDSEDVP